MSSYHTWSLDITLIFISGRLADMTLMISGSWLI